MTTSDRKQIESLSPEALRALWRAALADDHDMTEEQLCEAIEALIAAEEIPAPAAKEAANDGN